MLCFQIQVSASFVEMENKLFNFPHNVCDFYEMIYE